MLLELRLKDFVLISETRLEFAPGLIVLTGETGAGKSLLIQSLKLLLGARGGAHLIRPGAKEAVLEAVFEGHFWAERLASLGLPSAEELVIRRIITPERSRIYLNGSPVTAQMLAKLTQGFIILAGQHEHQLLARPEERLAFLDLFSETQELLLAYQEAYRRFRQAEAAYQDLLLRRQQAERERDFLAFQIREIEEIAPQPGEDEELEAERQRLRNLEKLKDLSQKVSGDLSQAARLLAEARRTFLRILELDAGLSGLEERLEGLYYEVEDLSQEVSAYSRGLQGEEGRLEEIENRLYQLKRLKRKYGLDLNQVLKELARLKEELAVLERGEERLAELESELTKAREEVYALGRKLSEKRQQGAKRLSELVSKRLSSLAMPEARFQVEVKRLEEPKETGFDQVEFLVATAPQSPLRPLSRVASGGELSRLFLALRVATSTKETSLFLFDEVDAGIGGETAHRVGELLKELSRQQQVICVTHWPQIAALADQHFVVEKVRQEGEVETRVRALSPEERRLELARMLGGPETVNWAQELVEA